jgi:transposase
MVARCGYRPGASLTLQKMARASYKQRMPWKASSVMEEKLRFVFEYERDEQTMTELCQSFGVARETGYVWLRRYRAWGVAGLLELNRAAQRHLNQTPAEIEQRVLELRQAHMRWGPRKLKRVLERDQGGGSWPAASTIGAMLKREGLVVARKPRRKTAPYTQPLAHADGPNRVWCADFKGWFRTGDGELIDPLTISDAHSRYLLRCQAVAKTDRHGCKPSLKRPFASMDYRKRFAPTMGHPLPARRSPDCRGWRCGGSSWGSWRSGSRRDSRSRTGGTSACIAPCRKKRRRPRRRIGGRNNASWRRSARNTTKCGRMKR